MNDALALFLLLFFSGCAAAPVVTEVIVPLPVAPAADTDTRMMLERIGAVRAK